MKTTKAQTTEETFDYMVALQPALDKIEEETGIYWNAWIQPLRGEMAPEFTDIKWTAIQMLIYWADESGVPFEKCARQFLRQFRLELKNRPLTPKEQKLYDDSAM